MSSVFTRIAVATGINVLLAATQVAAFVPGLRWSSTASGSTGSQGDPATLTWSFVPDGTTIPGDGPSDLISFLDANFGIGPGGSDLTQRPWFRLFEESFGRFAELGGLSYVYEPNDDGVTHGANRGILNRRGDIRIGGTFIDGSGNVLAYNGLPNNGDMALDTGDASFYRSASGDFLRMRNVIMHEHGHGFGLYHVESNNAAFLMEPFLSTAFDGPQFDDLRGYQRFYGDVYEKSNDGLGNDLASTATDLGSLLFNEPLGIGYDAGTGTRIEPDEIDFVSIDDNLDTDFYSFNVPAAGDLDVVLTPLGATYNQGPQGGTQSSFNASRTSDLSLAIFDIDGESLLAQTNDFGVGVAETILDLNLTSPGEYFVRVSGSADNIQFYQLELELSQFDAPLDADFDQDGDVDGNDFLTWQGSFLTSAGALLADGDADGDGDVDGQDFLAWQGAFDGGGSTSITIPEPSGVLLGGLAAIAMAVAARPSSSTHV